MSFSSNAAICDTALELIKELHNNPDIIPPYNEPMVKKCAEQITDLYDTNMKALLEIRSGSASEEEKTMTMVRARQAAIDRIKQCCCAYIDEVVLAELCYQINTKFSANKPDQAFALEEREFTHNSVKANLSKEELTWLGSYSESIFKFQNKFGENGVNLLNHVHPPKTLLIHVRALQDFGEFETSDGTTVVFTKNSMHFLPVQDCENLIRRGVLENAS
uniref:DNA replication complex GINS protein PSF1 n=1 Tax=Ditylenchus dipsaci TaxID=166011 RepID=A0A915DZH4_9BILA